MNNYHLKNVRYFDSRHDKLNGPVDIYIYDEKIHFNKKENTEYIVIDCNSYVLMPSFAQLHVHLCQHLYKGLAEDMSLFEWLEKHILPYESKLNNETIYLSSKLALYEMIDSGTTAFLDMGTFNNQEYIFKAIEESYIDGFSGNILMDKAIGKYYNNIQDYVKYTEQLIERYKDNSNVHYVLCPRFLPGISERGMRIVKELSDKYDLFIHTHASETKEEIEFTQKHYSMNNIELMERMNLLSERTIIAHAIYINDNEIELIKQTNTNIVHCPSANMKLGSGIAEIDRMYKEGINICLGSDGAPCNNNNNQLIEMRLAGLLQKVKYGSSVLKAKDIFSMATINGFKCLGLKKGLIEENYYADILLVRNNSIHQSDFSVNPFNTLIYSSYKDDIEWVFSNGKAIKENGKVTVFDKDHLFEMRKQFLKDLFNNRF